MTSVLVINVDLGPLHRVSLRHAIRMLCRRVAEVHESEPDIRYAPFGGLPKVIKLVRYVYAKWRHTSGPSWSRRGILARDNRKCGYCGVSGAYTIDHVTPQSRGGKSTWLNTVTACNRCNQRKGDRTPQEAGMTLLVQLTAPTWASALPAFA